MKHYFIIEDDSINYYCRDILMARFNNIDAIQTMFPLWYLIHWIKENKKV